MAHLDPALLPDSPPPWLAGRLQEGASLPEDSGTFERNILRTLPGWLGGYHGPPELISHMMRLCGREGSALHSSLPRLISSAPCDHLTCWLSGQAAVRSGRGGEPRDA